MTLDEQIEMAEAEVQRLHVLQGNAQRLRDELYIRRSKELHGIDVGMMVRARDDVFIVDEIRPEGWTKSKPWLHGRKIGKNGQPGTQRRTIYGDWEIVRNAD